MSILRFLRLVGANDGPQASPETETVRKIAQELDRLPPEQARYIAAFAYILTRVAHADLQISAEESHAMERLVSDVGGLSPEQAVLVVQIAKTQHRLFSGTENFLVTREFNRGASREQKLSLLNCLFAVSASDHSISSSEDSEIRQIADELKLDHRDFIAARSAFREHLAVLKGEE
jgi:uncharacterized tellurite resistance protein B-like protein